MTWETKLEQNWKHETELSMSAWLDEFHQSCRRGNKPSGSNLFPFNGKVDTEQTTLTSYMKAIMEEVSESTEEFLLGLMFLNHSIHFLGRQWLFSTFKMANSLCEFRSSCIQDVHKTEDKL